METESVVAKRMAATAATSDIIRPSTCASTMSKPFLALEGIYRFIFLYLEPFSTIIPSIMIWGFPGAAWFYSELVPGTARKTILDPPALMAIWQLSSC